MTTHHLPETNTSYLKHWDTGRWVFPFWVSAAAKCSFWGVYLTFLETPKKTTTLWKLETIWFTTCISSRRKNTCLTYVPKKTNVESTNQVVCCVFMETSWKSVIFFSRGPSFWLWNNISKTLHLTKTHMEPENYLFEKESHLPSTSIFGFHLSFRVVIFHKDATHRDSNASHDVLLSSPPTLIFPWSFVSRICLPHQKWGGNSIDKI